MDYCGVAGGNRGWICHNNRGSALNESANAQRRIPPSLCPRKDDIGPIGWLLDDLICEIDVNDSDGSTSDETWRNRVSNRCRVSLYA